MFLCPVQSPCRITQHFGQNPKDYAGYGLKGHDGIDITGPEAGVSVPTYAPYDGRVTVVTGLSGWTAYGTAVVIETQPDTKGRTRQIVLGHHRTLSVKDGQWVNIGDQIGIMGQTGAARGLHLHCGLRYILPDGSIENFKNGFHGWIDFEPYLLFWKQGKSGMVSYPNG